MTHLDRTLLQRYLAGELDLMATEEAGSHLAVCPACSQALAELAADDAALAGALALDESEQAWVSSLDLTGPVLQQIRPRPVAWQTFIICVLALAPVVYAFRMTAGLARFGRPSLGSLPDLIRELVPALLDLSGYLSNGGLIPKIWPALLLGAVLVFRRHTKKEDSPHA